SCRSVCEIALTDSRKDRRDGNSFGFWHTDAKVWAEKIFNLLNAVAKIIDDKKTVILEILFAGFREAGLFLFFRFLTSNRFLKRVDISPRKKLVSICGNALW